MTHELIERYIYAATKRLPAKTRKDIAAELESLISDMLEERCGEITPTEKDIRVILTELGTPDELAQKYDDDKFHCLIGTPYYSTYKFVLKIVLVCVVFGMSIAGIINFLESPEPLWYLAFFQWIGMIFSGVIFAFGFVTLLFAFFYRKGVHLDISSDLSSLPPVPKEKEGISKWEPILGIVFSILFMVIFYFAPGIFIAVTKSEQGVREVIPVLNAEVIRSTWYYLLAFGLLCIISEIVKLVSGRYTYKVMATTVIANILSALLAFAWFLKYQIINPAALAKFANLFDGESNFIANGFANFQVFLLAIILFSLVIDTGCVIYYTLKYGNNAS